MGPSHRTRRKRTPGPATCTKRKPVVIRVKLAERERLGVVIPVKLAEGERLGVVIPVKLAEGEREPGSALATQTCGSALTRNGWRR